MKTINTNTQKAERNTLSFKSLLKRAVTVAAVAAIGISALSGCGSSNQQASQTDSDKKVYKIGSRKFRITRHWIIAATDL